MYARILRLASHTAVYSIGSVASKVIALLLLPLYTRYLSPTSYGIVEAVLVINLFTAAIFRLGLQNAMMRFYYDARSADEPADADADERLQRETGVRVVRTALALTLVAMVVASLLLVAAARPIADFLMGEPHRAYFVWIAAFGMFSSVVYSTITATFRLQQRPHAFVAVSLGNIALSTLLALYLVTELKLGARGLLLGNFGGFLLMVPVAAAMQRRFVVPRIDRSLVRPMLRFGLPTIPIAIAFQALTLIDRTVISRTLGLDELGVYGVAARFAGVVLLVVTALQLSWQPIAYSIRDDDEARRTYALVTTWFAAVMGWLVAGLALLADPVVRLMAHDDYHGATRLVPLLALAAGIYGAYFLVGIGASRVKRTGWHVGVAVGAVVTSLVANLALVPVLGALGAAISAVAANLALVVLMLLRSQHVFRVRYDIARLARPIVLVLAAVAAAYVLPTGTEWSSWASRLALALAWPVLLVASGFVQPAEWQRIRAKLRRRDEPGPHAGAGGAG